MSLGSSNIASGRAKRTRRRNCSRVATRKQAACSTAPPAAWDRFGGWKDGPQLDATGWFRTAKHDGKWQLVDPDGRLFFSLGIDGVGFGDATIIDERKHWFEKLPPDDAANREFYMSWKVTMARITTSEKTPVPSIFTSTTSC